MQIRAAADAAAFIVQWLKDQAGAAGAGGIVVGLSGGIDSAVVAALGRRAFGRNMLALIMPCHSNPADAEDAHLVASELDIPCRTVDLTQTYETLAASLDGAGITISSLAGADSLAALSASNLKARLRMSTLYASAQALGYLVCGTSNRSEFETGYFTKFGDSASDLLPLADLLKCEVRALAEHLGVPERIITKPPSAGLWEGQTDEGDMGFSYDELDRYLADGEYKDESFRNRVESMRSKSEHKRRPVPIAKP